MEGKGAFQFLKCRGYEDGRGYFEECCEEGKGLYVLCGWKRESLPRKDGQRWEKEEEIVQGEQLIFINRVGTFVPTLFF